jgi:methionine synthase I (cobalamin-dependent)
MTVREQLEKLMAERILVLDGSWGVLLQSRGISEQDWRGERFASHSHDVQGDPDLLNLTHPDLVSSIHHDYFAAGADIATTNTFTATSIGQADYALEGSVYEMNLAGARLARATADVTRMVRERIPAPLLLGQAAALEQHAPGAVEEEDPLGEKLLELRVYRHLGPN